MDNLEEFELDMVLDGHQLRDAELDEVIHYFVYYADLHAELLLA